MRERKVNYDKLNDWVEADGLLIDLPTSHLSCSHRTLGNPKSHFSTLLFIHDSDYLRRLRIKRTATVILQLRHDCLLTVTWTVLSSIRKMIAGTAMFCYSRTEPSPGRRRDENNRRPVYEMTGHSAIVNPRYRPRY